MKKAQNRLFAFLMAISCPALFGQSPISPDPSPAVQSEPNQAPEPIAPSEPTPTDPQEQLRQEKEDLLRQIESLRHDLAETKASFGRSVSQKSTLQATLTNLQKDAGACRNQIADMRPTIVTDADVIRKTDTLLVWRIILDKAGPVLAILEEIPEDGGPIFRKRLPSEEWNKSHVLPFSDLQDATHYHIVVYTNTNQSGSVSGETIIGDPKIIGDLTSETERSLTTGRLEFSPIEFSGRKALFTVTAKDASVRATFRCAKYVAADKDRMPLKPQSLSEWIAPPPFVKEQEYVPTSGIMIQKDEQKKLECPGETEPNAFYQVQFEGLDEASGRRLGSANNDASFQAPVTFGFEDGEFGLAFNPENLNVTWEATLVPHKASLTLLVDQTSKEKTNLTVSTEPTTKKISLSLSTKDLLKKRIQDKKIDEPLTFQIEMQRDGKPPVTRLFRVSYLVDGAGGLTPQQKEKLQEALESFAKNETPSGRITWQEVFRLGLPVIMSLL